MRAGTRGFIGARLRQARESRAISAVSLAEVAGVTRAAISQYENGHQSPSPEVMKRISDGLSFPVHWFLRPIVPRKSETIFYRSMASATKNARLRAEARFQWLREIAEWLQCQVKMPEVQLPNLNPPLDPIKISDEMIEEYATEARRFWGLKDGPISNTVWLLENRGCVVARTDLHAATLDAFSVFDSSINRPFVVLAADKNCAVRSRFDAMHELAHLLLHRHLEPAFQKANHDLLEHQAHYFANAFLLPASTFGTEFSAPVLDVFRSMKERWRVAIQAMIMRVWNLKLIDDNQRKHLLINLARRKWRTREPLDDTLEPEQPRFLKKCFELLIERGVLSSHEVPALLGLNARDVEEVACLERGYLDYAYRTVQMQPTTLQDKDCDSQMIFKFPTRNSLE